MGCEIPNTNSCPVEYRTLSAPLSSQIDLTETCPNTCVHCYNYYRPSKEFASLSPEQTVAVVEHLGKAGVFSVTFTGGEPLVVTDSLLAGLNECKRWNISPSLNSSLNCGSPDDFRALKAAGLNGVLCSLMSASESTHDRLAQRKNAFRQTVEGIKNAKLAELKVIINMVVSQNNLGDVYDTGRFCHQALGINTFCATRVGPGSYNLEWFNEHMLDGKDIKTMLDQMLRLQEEFGITVDTLEPIPYCCLGDLKLYQVFTRRSCTAGVTHCVVGADGMVRPCAHIDAFYGNIIEENFQEIWQRMQEWRDGSLTPEECWDCGYLTQCKSGCRMAGKYAAGKDGKLGDPDLYASSEKDVVAGLPVPQDCKLPHNFHSLPLSIHPLARKRVEEFGGVIGVGGQNCTFVNPYSFSLILQLEQRDSFRLNDLRDELNLTRDELTTFFGPLFTKNIVIRTDK